MAAVFSIHDMGWEFLEDEATLYVCEVFGEDIDSDFLSSIGGFAHVVEFVLAANEEEAEEEE